LPCGSARDEHEAVLTIESGKVTELLTGLEPNGKNVEANLAKRNSEGGHPPSEPDVDRYADCVAAFTRARASSTGTSGRALT
jgi:hypothetical protein